MTASKSSVSATAAAQQTGPDYATRLAALLPKADEEGEGDHWKARGGRFQRSLKVALKSRPKSGVPPVVQTSPVGRVGVLAGAANRMVNQAEAAQIKVYSNGFMGSTEIFRDVDAGKVASYLRQNGTYKADVQLDGLHVALPGGGVMFQGHAALNRWIEAHS